MTKKEIPIRHTNGPSSISPNRFDYSPGDPHYAFSHNDNFLKAKHITLVPQKWVIEELLPAGEITAIVGDQGVGKTTIEVSIGALVSNAALKRPFGNGSMGADIHGTVLMFSVEDSINTTLLPRAMAAEADLEKFVFWYPATVSYPSTQKNLSHEPMIIQKIRDYPDVQLVLFDHFDLIYSGYPQTPYGRKSALLALTNLARKQQFAVIANAHYSKSASRTGNPLDRIAGGNVIATTVRRIMYVEELTPHDLNNATRQFALFDTKLSINGKRLGLRYSIEEATVNSQHGPHKTSCIKWHGRIDDDFREELVSRSRQPLKRKVSLLDKAIEFLRAFLADGERSVSDLEEAAKAVDISHSTLLKARSALGVQARKIRGAGQSSRWVCSLPEVDSEAPESELQTSKAEQSTQVSQLSPEISTESPPGQPLGNEKST